MIDFAEFIARSAELSTQLPAPHKVTEHQTEGLYLRVYEPEQPCTQLLVVYHGGGASSTGYEVLARQHTLSGQTAVCLVDIRGHGRSCGVRGSADSPKQIWRDVDTVLAYLRELFPQLTIRLLGHSSGAGMLLNYCTRHTPQHPISHLTLLAPEFGPFAPPQLRKNARNDFATAKVWPFVINAMSGGLLLGNYYAITLHYPAAVIAQTPDIVSRYNVNMANALTPRHPAKQLAALSLPTTVVLAEQDELFDAEEVVRFEGVRGNKHIKVKVIESAGHLTCIFDYQ